MQIAQMLQSVPQTVPTAGTASEAAGGPSGEAGLFAALFAGLLSKPVDVTAGVPVPSGEAKTSPAAKEPTGKTDDPAPAAAAAPPVTPVPFALAPPVPLSTSAKPSTEPTTTPASSTAGDAPAVTGVAALLPKASTTAPPASLPVTGREKDAAGSTPLPTPALPLSSTATTPPTAAAQVLAGPAGETVEVVQLTVAPTGGQAVTGSKLADVPLPDRLGEGAVVPQPQQVVDQPEVRTAALTTAPAARLATPQEGKADVRQGDAAAPETAADHAAGSSGTAKVEIVVRKESGEQQFADNRELAGERKEQQPAKDQGVVHLVGDSGKPPATTVTDSRPQTAGETHPALRDSVMAQVKDALATRQPTGDGQIAIRLNPAELGELRINVHVVDQHVKVEVVAANSQVRDVLLNNLDSLKENFSRQNLTMSGFNVSTGGGQGSEQFFRDGWATGQRLAGNQLGQGMVEEQPGTVLATDYYTDRRDNSLVDVRF